MKFPPDTSFGAWGNDLSFEAHGPCSEAKPCCSLEPEAVETIVK